MLSSAVSELREETASRSCIFLVGREATFVYHSAKVQRQSKLQKHVKLLFN